MGEIITYNVNSHSENNCTSSENSVSVTTFVELFMKK